MNTITIAGHLGADPEVRFTSTGKKVTTLRVATHTRKGNADDTIWWRVTIWGDQFDKMLTYLKKGSSVIVTGDLQKPELFTDRDGKQQISMNITAFNIQFSPFGKPDRATAGQGGQEAHSHQEAGAQMGKAPVMQGQGGTYDDEVPF